MWLTAIISFFANLFKRTRDGLDKFISDHHDTIFPIVKDLADQNNGAPLIEWEDQAFNIVKNVIAASVPDSWIKIALLFAYDEVKKIIEDKTKELGNEPTAK